jgi:predicted ATP-grasp superfamily ATP-dependent carboligase
MSAKVFEQTPAIVWGLESQIGLWIVRELGQQGIPVFGLAGNKHGLARASRYVVRSEVAQPRGPDLLAQLQRLGGELGPSLLFAVSEHNVLWLTRHRDQLGAVKALVPGEHALTRALDKRVTLELAQQIGIRTPRTAQPLLAKDVDQIAGDFPLPAVLKWPDPNDVQSLLRSAALPFLKVEHVGDRTMLLASLHRYDPCGAWPLVQEYCAGRGLGQFFFMHRGQAIRRFQHLRIAEWPPEGGFSSVCDAVPLTEYRELQKKSVELLRRMDWEGVAMVEYRLDEAAGEAALMEVNGRYWGSFPLAAQAGAGFALYQYFAQGLGQTIELPPPRDNLRCRMVSTELKRLVRILLQGSRSNPHIFTSKPFAEVVRFCVDFLRPRVRYYVWQRSDPRPFLADLINVFLRRSV